MIPDLAVSLLFYISLMCAVHFDSICPLLFTYLRPSAKKMSILILLHKTVQKNVHNNNENVVYMHYCSGLSIKDILKI